MRLINRRKRFYSVGVDIFLPYSKEARSWRSHDDYVLADARVLPIKEKSFDIVLCLKVIEHLEKKEGINLIKELEKIACRQVIIGTSVGFMERQSDRDPNPHQTHRSGWTSAEFRQIGYKVRGRGIPRPLLRTALMRLLEYWLPDFFRRTILGPAGCLADPLEYIFPSLAGNMVCTKSLTVKEVNSV